MFYNATVTKIMVTWLLLSYLTTDPLNSSGPSKTKLEWYGLVFWIPKASLNILVPNLHSYTDYIVSAFACMGTTFKYLHKLAQNSGYIIGQVENTDHKVRKPNYRTWEESLLVCSALLTDSQLCLLVKGWLFPNNVRAGYILGPLNPVSIEPMWLAHSLLVC